MLRQDVATLGDPPAVGRLDEQQLRRFLAARDKGDPAAMRAAWEDVVVVLFDRVDGLVAASHKERLDDEEHELAVEMALARIGTNLLWTFKGTSMGELVKATLTLCNGICIDVQRMSMRRREHEAGSFDDGWHLDGEDAPPPVWEADAAADRLAADGHAGEAQDFLAWALPQLNDGQRVVLELGLSGLSGTEIAERLRIEPDTVHQRRSRGLKALRPLHEEFFSA